MARPFRSGGAAPLLSIIGPVLFSGLAVANQLTPPIRHLKNLLSLSHLINDAGRHPETLSAFDRDQVRSGATMRVFPLPLSGANSTTFVPSVRSVCRRTVRQRHLWAEPGR